MSIEKLNFKSIPYNYCLTGLLGHYSRNEPFYFDENFSKKCKQIQALQEFFDVVFASGGFIAGSFANIHLRSNLIIMSPPPDSGDIDIFFPNKEALARVLSYLNSSTKKLDNVFIQTTLNSYSFSLLGKQVQLIDKIFGTEKEVLGSFDFLNCMVAFNKNELIFEKRIPYFEGEKILHAVRQTTPARFFKYTNGKGYVPDEKTLKLFQEAILEEINKQNLTSSEVLYLTRDALSSAAQIPLETLILLVGLIPQDHSYRFQIDVKFREKLNKI